MRTAHFALLCILLMLSGITKGQYKIEVLDSNTFILGDGVILSKTSFRGLSVVDDKNIWVSGSRGTIARSTDGGKTFVYAQLKGYERSDFRDIEAFDAKRAIIMSSGTPAYILKTTDGGQSWKEVYKNTDSAYFLDAMDFWDDTSGVIVGDPINGSFILIQTHDGGDTWHEIDYGYTPRASIGEAVFAASGTSLKCWKKFGSYKPYGFVTGGKVSNFYQTYDNERWHIDSLHINSGKNSTGAFSFASDDNYQFLVVGGDYLNDYLTNGVFTYVTSEDHGGTIYGQLTGYRSCIENLGNWQFIACGTNGCDYYHPYPKGWDKISSEPFHVVRKAKKGNAVFLAGPKGKIGKLIK